MAKIWKLPNFTLTRRRPPSLGGAGGFVTFGGPDNDHCRGFEVFFRKFGNFPQVSVPGPVLRLEPDQHGNFPFTGLWPMEGGGASEDWGRYFQGPNPFLILDALIIPIVVWIIHVCANMALIKKTKIWHIFHSKTFLQVQGRSISLVPDQSCHGGHRHSNDRRPLPSDQYD